MPAKAFACICVIIFYNLYGSGLLAHGGGGGGNVQQPKNPVAKCNDSGFVVLHLLLPCGIWILSSTKKALSKLGPL